MVKFSEKQLFVVDLCLVFLATVLRFIDYLLFHSCLEFLCSLISVGIVWRLWSERQHFARTMVYCMSVTLVSVALIDILHFLAYGGMAIFPVAEADVASQLWIIGRYILAVGLLGAVTLRLRKGFAVLAGGAALLLLAAVAAVFSGQFPETYRVGEGLTQFKVMSEYIIIGILIATILRISFRQLAFSLAGHFWLILAIALTVLSELMFTLYFDLYGFFNFFGHILKLAAYLALLHLFQFHGQQEQI